MKPTYSTELFINQLLEKDSISDYEVTLRSKMITLYQQILSEDEITEEWLNAYTFEEMDWVLDMITFWPSVEVTIEPEDLNHVGVQHETIRYIIFDFLTMKEKVKKKVTFI